MVSKDPLYEEKKERILQLYNHPPSDGIVVSFDEKGSITLKEYGGSSWTTDAKERRVPDRQKTRGRVELAAAYFPHTGRIFTRFSEKKGSRELVELLKRIRSEYPEGKLYVILDNHRMHKSKELKVHLAVDRGIELIYTPTTSSWINAIEQVFASIQKWVLNNSSFQSIEEVTGMIGRHLTSLGERLVELLAKRPFTFALKMMVQVINPRPS
jgi:transposase